jgi:hypothetical protein
VEDVGIVQPDDAVVDAILQQVCVVYHVRSPFERAAASAVTCGRFRSG